MIKNISVSSTFPSERDFKEYLIWQYLVISKYLASPDHFSEKFAEIKDSLSQKVEELRELIANETAARKMEEKNKQDGELKLFLQTTRDLVQLHSRTLVSKRMQGVVCDEYRNTDDEKWLSEIEYFISRVVGRANPMPEWFGVNERLTVMNAIDALVAANQEERGLTEQALDNISPRDFEHLCAKILTNNGWITVVTQASGDQGIDIIATRENLKAVFQCKKYGRPVGNSAVQEILAGKQFESADVAIVVSNSSFTQSAKKLANATGVYLLHYSELDGFLT